MNATILMLTAALGLTLPYILKYRRLVRSGVEAAKRIMQRIGATETPVVGVMETWCSGKRVRLENRVIKNGFYCSMEVQGERGFPDFHLPQQSKPVEPLLRLEWLPKVVFSRASWLSKVGKVLGQNREIEFGDPRFDSTVYVNTAAPEKFLRRLLADSETRMAIAELVQSEWKRITVYDRRALVALRIAKSAPGVNVSPGAYERYLNLVTKIADSIPPVRVKHTGRQKFRWPTVVMITTALGALVSVLIASRHSESWQTLGGAGGALCGLVALTIGGIGGAFLFFLMRGHSNSFSMFLAALIFFGVTAWFSSTTLGRFGNAVLDDSPARLIKATVVKREIKGAYYITVDPGEEGPLTRLRVDEHEYCEAIKTYAMKLRKGAFGWTWIERKIGS